VLELRLQGYGNADIAEMLGISVKTVDAHWQKIRKVGLQEREREREREKG
jgi:DNA-binding CsgD family transcriptional regulator